MPLRHLLLTAAGLLLLAVGAVGLVLPVLPTTPFWLASAACLTGSPKLRAKVMRIPIFREYVENYQNRRGLPRKIVVKSLSFLWLMLILSMILVQKAWLTLLLIGIGIAVTIHILTMARPKEKQA